MHAGIRPILGSQERYVLRWKNGAAGGLGAHRRTIDWVLLDRRSGGRNSHVVGKIPRSAADKLHHESQPVKNEKRRASNRSRCCWLKSDARLWLCGPAPSGDLISFKNDSRF